MTQTQAVARVIDLAEERRRLRPAVYDPFAGLYLPQIFFWPAYFWLALLGSPKCR
jgi:hypothetical protein